MRKTNTKTVLAIGFSIVILVTIILAFIGVSILHTSTQRIDSIVHSNNLKHNLIMQMRTAGRERTVTLQKMFILDDVLDIDEEWEKFNAEGSKFIIAYNELKKLNFSPEEQALFTEEERLMKLIAPIQHRVAELVFNEKINEARTLLLEQAIPHQQAAFAGMSKMMKIQNKNAKRSVLDAKQEYREALNLLILLASLGVIICFTIAYIITRRVSSAEQELKQSHNILETRVSERTQELFKTTEYLQFVLSSTPAIIYTANASAHFLYTNFISDNTQSLMGYTPEQFIENSEFWRSHIHPDDLENTELSLADLYEHHSQLNEFRFLFNDGQYHWIENGAKLIFDNDDQPQEIVGYLVDITDRKQAELNLIHAKDDADRANKAKSMFLSSMSHELRTPLNAILGFGQLLNLEESLPGKMKSFVDEILKAGDHLLGLINEVLDLAKIEAGHIDLLLEPIEYDKLITECISLVEPIATHNHIDIINSSSSSNAVFRADRTRTKQVFVNLLSNAIKYNRAGGNVNICIELSKDNYYRISIKDTGVGIKEKNMSRLFESFNRLEAENTNIEGTGIGLVITKHLVELMGGNIGVESEYGIGSTFYIELPKESITVSSKDISKIVEVSSQNINDNEEFKILYIEDNPTNITLVTQLLARKPHIRLYTAHTPSLGLELAEIKTPDLILLDIQLPEINGYEVLRRLRSNSLTSDTPVVGISANAMPSDLKKANEAGFDDYLTKPIDVNRFYKTIDGILSGVEV